MASVQVRFDLTCHTVSSSLILWRGPKLGEKISQISKSSLLKNRAWK